MSWKLYALNIPSRIPDWVLQLANSHNARTFVCDVGNEWYPRTDASRGGVWKLTNEERGWGRDLVAPLRGGEDDV